jgi:glycerol-3-phosphate dehydrogenase
MGVEQIPLPDMPCMHLTAGMSSSDQQRPSLDGRHFDIAIIGGGINGVAIARECAGAGKSVLLLEQNDFASGTTSRSTRIFHGGLRYLEQGELGLVRESLRERERQLREQPHLVRPIEFLLALEPGARHSALAIRAGLWLYGAVGGSGQRLRARESEARRLEELLDAGKDWSVFSYEDAQCEFPELLVAEWLAEAIRCGAIARNYASALQLECPRGRVSRLTFRDRLNGQEQDIEATWIINATGPWADRVCAQFTLRGQRRMVGGLRGSHIVLRQFSGMPTAAIYTEAADGRPFFAIPWNGQLLVGTTEVADEGDPGSAQPAEDEIEYLLQSLSRLFPGRAFSSSDIRYAFAGVRPLPYSPGCASAAITRRHMLYEHSAEGAAGLISVIGGKLTTAASLARECARKIGLETPEAAPAWVAMGAATGVESSLRQWARQISGLAQIPESSAYTLGEWHGRRALGIARMAANDERLRLPLCPHSDHLVAEAVSAMHNLCAVTLADILLRRVPVALGACWSEECTQMAAAGIGEAMGWSERQISQAAEDFEEDRGRFLKPAAMSLVSSHEATSSGLWPEHAA